MNLRSKLIRLAHSKPELRDQILPLLAPRSKRANDLKVSPDLVSETRALLQKAEDLLYAFDDFNRKANAEFDKFERAYLDRMDELAKKRDDRSVEEDAELSNLLDLNTLYEDLTELTNKKKEQSIQYKFQSRIHDLDGTLSWAKGKRLL
jgi:hypothetical protein